eukprot:1144733-Pelagomonas_calceolata.AAC.5
MPVLGVIVTPVRCTHTRARAHTHTHTHTHRRSPAGFFGRHARTDGLASHACPRSRGRACRACGAPAAAAAAAARAHPCAAGDAGAHGAEARGPGGRPQVCLRVCKGLRFWVGGSGRAWRRGWSPRGHRCVCAFARVRLRVYKGSSRNEGCTGWHACKNVWSLLLRSMMKVGCSTCSFLLPSSVSRQPVCPCRRAVERLHEERDEARAAVEALQMQVESERQQAAVAVEEVGVLWRGMMVAVEELKSDLRHLASMVRPNFPPLQVDLCAKAKEAELNARMLSLESQIHWLGEQNTQLQAELVKASSAGGDKENSGRWGAQLGSMVCVLRACMSVCVCVRVRVCPCGCPDVLPSAVSVAQASTKLSDPSELAF